jgi:hypothetical protein
VKWVLLATAPDQLTAEMWAKLLRDEGIPATLKPGDAVSFLGVSAMPCRLLVPDGRVGEARAVLAEYRGETGL